MDIINLLVKLVNNLKYYLEIDDVMVFPEKHQSKYCIFQIDVDRYTGQDLHLYLNRWR